MEPQFKNKVALVTGSTFGIGKATAIAFAKNGAQVVLSDWMEDEDTLQTIKDAGGDAIFVQCDVSKEKDIINLVTKTKEHFGRLDYAFNNAGVEGTPAPAHECTDEIWDRVMNINLKGLWYCMKHQIPLMLQNGGGVIINNASIAGLVGFSGIPPYVASKHGVVGITKNVALDYAKQGIRCNAVCPGVIRTPMIDRFTGNNKEVEMQFAGLKPMGRIGEPREVADAVIYLCSDGASFITGQALAIDGGWTVQ